MNRLIHALRMDLSRLAPVDGIEVIATEIQRTFGEQTMQYIFKKCIEVNVDPDALLKTSQLNSKLLAQLRIHETPESPFLDGDPNILACPLCGSGDHLHNADGNRNVFCGRCGKAIDWDERKDDKDDR